MAVTLITKNIWATLTKSAKLSKTKSMVAVAYFGQNGAKMLPLKKGSMLLVDASEKAVKSGQTCPDELLKLYYKGVQVYSMEHLHAKMFIIGRELFIGSTNVSGNSSRLLQEAIVKTNDKQAIEGAREFIERHRHIELGEDQLMRLQKLYRPPRMSGISAKKESSRKTPRKAPAFLVYLLSVGSWSKEEQAQSDLGKKEAQTKRINKSRHTLDEFKWGRNFVARKGDTIMQIIDEGHQEYVSPPGTLVHVRKWNNGKTTTHFCYVEIPNRRRKNLKVVKKQLGSKVSKLIQRNGRKNAQIASRLLEYWDM